MDVTTEKTLHRQLDSNLQEHPSVISFSIFTHNENLCSFEAP